MEVRDLDGMGKSLNIHLAVSQRLGMVAPAADHLMEKKTYHSTLQLEEM